MAVGHREAEMNHRNTERRFIIHHGKRRLRPLDYSAYLLSNPETARRILAAVADSRAGRMLTVEGIDELRAALFN